MEESVKKRVQPPRIVEGKLDNLPPDAPPEERAMLLWMLRRGKYPNWRYEVKKAVDAEVNVSGNVDIHATGARVLGAKADTSLDGDLNLSEILSVENPDNSYESLTNLTPPKTYRPVPTVVGVAGVV